MRLATMLVALLIFWARLCWEFVQALQEADGPSDAFAAYLFYYPVCTFLGVFIINCASDAFSTT